MQNALPHELARPLPRARNALFAALLGAGLLGSATVWADTIRIGYISPLTGSHAEFSQLIGSMND